jgi:hypothetical protein
MKKILLNLGLVLFATGSLVAQSIPNRSFENWTANTWLDPLYYMSVNDQSGGLLVAANRVSPGYHGSYAVQLNSYIVGTDTGAGYIIDGNPNGGSVSGGIPYAQKPTGIRVYYKYSKTQKDTALIIVFFKKGGAVKAQYLCQIINPATSFTLFTETFSPALTITPDTVVFGAVTSSNVFTNGSGRAGSVLTIDSVTFTGVTSQPTMLNGDFENWTSDTTLSLNGWEMTQYPGAQRTTDASAGKYALELVTMNNGGGNQPGFADDGMQIQTSSTTDTTIGAHPFANQIDTLVLSYKYIPADTADRANVYLQFSKSSTYLGEYGTQLSAASSYTTIEMPFNVGSAPDSVLTFLQSSNYTISGIPNSYLGAVFKVDNMYFKSQISVGIAPINDVGNIKVYPNPVTSQFNIDMSNFSGKLQSVVIYDMSGKEVVFKNFMFSSVTNNIETFDMSNYAAGVYNVIIHTDKGMKYEKLTKVQ